MSSAAVNKHDFDQHYKQMDCDYTESLFYLTNTNTNIICQYSLLYCYSCGQLDEWLCSDKNEADRKYQMMFDRIIQRPSSQLSLTTCFGLNNSHHHVPQVKKNALMKYINVQT